MRNKFRFPPFLDGQNLRFCPFYSGSHDDHILTRLEKKMDFIIDGYKKLLRTDLAEKKAMNEWRQKVNYALRNIEHKQTVLDAKYVANLKCLDFKF